jgi:hypothetical protein
MSRTLTISSAAGRIYPQRPAEEPSGHLLTVDFASASAVTATCMAVSISATGEIFTADSRGNVTQFWVRENRYAQCVRNIFTCSFIGFVKENCVFLTHGNQVAVYLISGKRVMEGKQHYSCIKDIVLIL